MTSEILPYSSDLVSSPELNRKLIRLGRRSGNEIEALTGIPAAEALERLAVLMDTRTWRTDLQEEALVLMEYGDLLEDVKTRLDSAKSEEGYASIARVVLTALKDLMTRLEKRRAGNQADMERVNQAQAKLMIDAINLSMEKASFELQKRYPEVDLGELNQIFHDALPEAVERVGRSTVG